MLQKQTTKGKGDTAHRRLRRLIESGGLDPSERLTEARACELVDMNRGPVREALLRLQGQGLLGSQGHSRSRVIRYLEDENRQDLIARYEVRQRIEAGIVRLATENMTGRQLDELGEIIRPHAVKVTGDRQKGYEAYLKFLDYLMDHCGNPLMRDIWERYGLGPIMSRSAKFDALVVRSLPENERGQRSIVAVLEAIVAHDADRAEQLVRERIGQLIKVLRTMEWESISDAEEGEGQVED